MTSSIVKRNGLWVPSKTRMEQESLITPTANVVATNLILQAGTFARQWMAGLMQGIWQGGNNWLVLEVGTGTNTSETTPSHLGAPVLRKLVDSISFTLLDGLTATNGPSTTLQLDASLQTPDANGLTITEYGIYGGGLNLNQSPFSTGLLLLYSTITPIAKTSSTVVDFQIVIQT
jgi:hypothetical protein